MTGYKQFHSLTRSPFGKGLEPTQLLLYPQLKEFCDEFEELLVDGGPGTLTGEMGIGKTTAVRHALAHIEDRSMLVAYHGSSRHSTALLAGLVESLGLQAARLRVDLLRQISLIVTRSYKEQRKKTLLVIDDAHLVEDNLLEDLRLLTNFELDSADPLILLFVGHPSLRARLRKPIHQALLDRIQLHYRLEGLSASETDDYIDFHLQAAGSTRDAFTPEARQAIFEYAQGIPRRINAVALAALKKSSGRKIKPVDAECVHWVITTLVQADRT